MSWSSAERVSPPARRMAEAWAPEELSPPEPAAALEVEEAETAELEPGRAGVGRPAPAPEEAVAGTRAAAEASAGEAREAAAQIEEALAAAWREGYAAGHEAGARSAAERLESAVRACEDAARAVRAAQASRLAAIEDDLAALAVAAARHLVGQAVEIRPEIVADVVRRAVAHLPGEEPLQVRVNPEDLSLLAAGTSEDGRPIPIGPVRDIRWVADPQVARGGCIVEGRDRIVDGRVDMALERIYWMLRDA